MLNFASVSFITVTEEQAIFFVLPEKFCFRFTGNFAESSKLSFCFNDLELKSFKPDVTEIGYSFFSLWKEKKRNFFSWSSLRLLSPFIGNFRDDD